MTKEELAKWLHDTYEAVAKEKDWNTQQSCKVEFDALPDANKRTMIEIAEQIAVPEEEDLFRLIGVPFKAPELRSF